MPWNTTPTRFPADKDTQESHFSEAEVRSLMKEVPLFQDSDQHGWMGNGAGGIAVVRAETEWAEVLEKREVTVGGADQPERQVMADHGGSSAGLEETQVRLQANRNVNVPTSQTFMVLLETKEVDVDSITNGGDNSSAQNQSTITSLGSITLTIPSGGKISTSSTSSGNLPSSVTHRNGIITLQSPPATQNHSKSYLLVPVEVKCKTEPYGTDGLPGDEVSHLASVDNLLAVWPHEEMKFGADIGGSHAGIAAQISWTTPENTVDGREYNRPLQQIVSYDSAGTRSVTLNVSGQPVKRVYIEVPYIGVINTAGAALLDPLSYAASLVYGADAISESYSFGDGNSAGFTECNAFRHAFWNAAMASDPTVGPTKALLFSTAHEFTNFQQGGRAMDGAMDMRNNTEGASIIHAYFFGTIPDYAAIRTDLSSRISSGRLWIIDQKNNMQIRKSGTRERIFPR